MTEVGFRRLMMVETEWSSFREWMQRTARIALVEFSEEESAVLRINEYPSTHLDSISVENNSNDSRAHDAQTMTKSLQSTAPNQRLQKIICNKERTMQIRFYPSPPYSYLFDPSRKTLDNGR